MTGEVLASKHVLEPVSARDRVTMVAALMNIDIIGDLGEKSVFGENNVRPKRAPRETGRAA